MTHKEAVEFMLRYKLVHFKTGDLEMTLHPDAFIEAALKIPKTEGGPDLDKVGKTGMTRREQIELLGTSFEADFRE